MKKSLTLLIALIAGSGAFADTLDIRSFKYAGPYPVIRPFTVDSLDVNGKAFDLKTLLDQPLSFDLLKTGRTIVELPENTVDALHLLGFSVQNQTFTKATVNLDGLKEYKIYLDGKFQEGKEVKLIPGTHDFAIEYFTEAGQKDSLKLSLVTARDGILNVREDGRHIFNLDVNTIGNNCSGISLSPSGELIAISTSIVLDDGKKESSTAIIRLRDSKELLNSTRRINWMHDADTYYFTRMGGNGRELVESDPQAGTEAILCSHLPEGEFVIAPSRDYLIFSLTKKGPKEGEVHEILNPEDRQEGWRDRNYLAKYDIASGLMQPLTYGYRNCWLQDISDDGRYLLFAVYTNRFTQRPTDISSLYLMDMKTFETEVMFLDQGFIGGARFSPDGKQILISGSPEAFDGIGIKGLKEGQTSSMTENLLFLFNIADKSVKVLTRDFIPSVESYVWSRADGKIYLTATEKDCQTLWRLDPKNGKIERLPGKEDNISRISIAGKASKMAYIGQGLENTGRVYLMDTRKLSQNVIKDYNSPRLDGIDLGKGYAYEFLSSRNDSINCFYVLPPDFDPQKKYPMVVHYYGGCSPTTRYCIGSYSPQYYAGQGFIFLAVNPSGATGFGQEFAARHVNTAGDVVADDIIEAVQHFCDDHPFVRKDKIGCFSASYGGFMTQLLLTKTDMFACGMSHAGISDHTSYWGYGYWGYSYSQVCMANSYPWSHRDLYVDHSPLYNADKIHTPLLFLHGSADHNVPIVESVQMFTALKLLGAETAFVVVDGEEHGIFEFNKRRQWLNTISAWFTKYLKDDDSWWNELYPPKDI